MASTARVDFTKGAAERIARVVVRVENGGRDGSPLTFGRALDAPANAKTFRMATFTASWNIDTTHVVTLLDSTVTVTARNVFSDVSVSTSFATTAYCALGRDMGTWFLLAARCNLG